MKSSSTTLPGMVARVRAACEPVIGPRRPRSRSRAVHPTGRALGSFLWSTGLWLARAWTTAREAKVCRGTPWGWWSRRQIPGSSDSQIGCRWRLCASGVPLRRCTGAIAGVSSTLPPPRESLHPPPGRRCRSRHALRPPAHIPSSLRPRRIFGPPGRHLAAHLRPCISFGRLRAAPAGSLSLSHLASRISLVSPTCLHGRGALRGQSDRIRRVGRSHSGCGSSSHSSSGSGSGSSSGPAHAPAHSRRASPRA